MKIAVLGAGIIGSAVVEHLAQRETIDQIQVCDARPGIFNELERRIKSDKLRCHQVDARDLNALRRVLRGSHCILSCLPPKLNPEVADLALELGAHFCDLGGDDRVAQQILALGPEANRKAVWLVPNCGLAPGLINILCMHGIDQFDTVDEARLRFGDIPLFPEPPLHFTIPFSAEQLIQKYTHPVELIQDGELTTFAPLTGQESISFAPPYGNLEAFYTSWSLSTLPHDLLGRVKTLDFKTVACPGHAEQMRFAIALGLTQPQSVDVRTHHTYRSLFVRRLQRAVPQDQPDAVLLRVLITGTRAGKSQSLVAELTETYDADRPVTAMKRCTAVSVASVAELLVSHHLEGGGAAPPERILPMDLFFALLAEHGLHIKTTWHDGAVDITQG